MDLLKYIDKLGKRELFKKRKKLFTLVELIVGEE